jgi:hypothetical protein
MEKTVLASWLYPQDKTMRDRLHDFLKKAKQCTTSKANIKLLLEQSGHAAPLELSILEEEELCSQPTQLFWELANSLLALRCWATEKIYTQQRPVEILEAIEYRDLMEDFDKCQNELRSFAPQEGLNSQPLTHQDIFHQLSQKCNHDREIALKLHAMQHKLGRVQNHILTVFSLLGHVDLDTGYRLARDYGLKEWLIAGPLIK